MRLCPRSKAKARTAGNKRNGGLQIGSIVKMKVLINHTMHIISWMVVEIDSKFEFNRPHTLALEYDCPIRINKIRVLMPKKYFVLFEPERWEDIQGVTRVNSRMNFESLGALTATESHPINWPPAMTGIPLHPNFLSHQTELAQSL
eukprot:12405087-Karenia_brevis.AAC.1